MFLTPRMESFLCHMVCVQKILIPSSDEETLRLERFNSMLPDRCRSLLSATNMHRRCRSSIAPVRRLTMVTTPARCPQQGSTRHEGARARRERRRNAAARLRLMLLRDAQPSTSHRGGPVAEPMRGSGKEIKESVRKYHDMVTEVRANFKAQLRQGEQKVDELSFVVPWRSSMRRETARAKRDEMKLAQACRNVAQKADLLPVLAVGVLSFLRNNFSYTCGATHSVRSVSCATSVPSQGKDVPTSLTRQS